MVAMGIRVNAEEEVRVAPVGQLDAVAERHKPVAAARHHDLQAVAAEPALQAAHDIQDHVLFAGAGQADRARVMAAVARVNDDPFEGRRSGGSLPAGHPAAS
jgi:hypothetical protein